MNLNENPSKDQLRELLASCDDNAGHHIIWVDHSGEVHITLLPPGQVPAEWTIMMSNKVKFRYETLVCGGGNVGPEASQADKWVDILFNWLQRDWQRDARGYIGD